MTEVGDVFVSYYQQLRGSSRATLHGYLSSRIDEECSEMQYLV